MKRACRVEGVKVRRSKEPGDFYFSWVAYVCRIRGRGNEITTHDYVIKPNDKKEYQSKINAYRSGKQCVEKVFGMKVLEIPKKVRK